MDRFLEKHNSLKLTQNETKSEHLYTLKKINLVLKNLPERKL